MLNAPCLERFIERGLKSKVLFKAKESRLPLPLFPKRNRFVLYNRLLPLDRLAGRLGLTELPRQTQH